jgi:hypothetical protein
MHVVYQCHAQALANIQSLTYFCSAKTRRCQLNKVAQQEQPTDNMARNDIDSDQCEQGEVSIRLLSPSDA